MPLCVLCGKENVLCKLIWQLVCARALEGTGREINRSATGLDAHVRFHLDLVALFLIFFFFFNLKASIILVVCCLKQQRRTCEKNKDSLLGFCFSSPNYQ